MVKAPQDRLPKTGARRAPVALVDIVQPEEMEELDNLPLFRLNGRVYTMPARVPVAMTLQFMEDAQTRGEEIAIMTAVRRHMGEEAWVALKSCTYLTAEQLGQVLDTVSELIVGEMEAMRPGN